MNILEKFGVTITGINIHYKLPKRIDPTFITYIYNHTSGCYYNHNNCSTVTGRFKQGEKIYVIKIATKSIHFYGVKGVNGIDEVFNKILTVYNLPNINMHDLSIVSVNAKYKFHNNLNMQDIGNIHDLNVSRVRIYNNGNVVFSDKSFVNVANTFLLLYNYITLPHVLMLLCGLKSCIFYYIPEDIINIIIKFIR